MKKIKFNGKLNLNKTTISSLNNEEKGAVVGGKVIAKKTATGPGVCTAMPTLFCCDDATQTGPGVCTAMPTLFCCDLTAKKC